MCVFVSNSVYMIVCVCVCECTSVYSLYLRLTSAMLSRVPLVEGEAEKACFIRFAPSLSFRWMQKASYSSSTYIHTHTTEIIIDKDTETHLYTYKCKHTHNYGGKILLNKSQILSKHRNIQLFKIISGLLDGLTVSTERQWKN